MTGTNMQLQQVAEQLYTGNVGKAIAEMETYLAAYPQQQTTEKLKGIKTEYQLMEDYWRKGVVDPQLTQLYQHLLQRLYVLFGNVASYYHTLSHPTLSGIYSRVRMEHQDWSLKMIRKEMEDFVSSVAMLEFETEQAREVKKELLYRNHQLQMNALFNYILTSRMWSDGVGHDFEEMLISPTIDGNDQQLLVSALTLSLLNQFDMAKFRTLVNVYRRSQEEAVRQRALVGWVLLSRTGGNSGATAEIRESMRGTDGIADAVDILSECGERHEDHPEGNHARPYGKPAIPGDTVRYCGTGRRPDGGHPTSRSL